VTPVPTLIPHFPPAADGRPGAPVPWCMTQDDVARFLQIDQRGERAIYKVLERFRKEGWLTATQVGKEVRYLLPDVLACLANMREECPR
jgi:DNA-binding transcriptional regulator PaaX